MAIQHGFGSDPAGWGGSRSAPVPEVGEALFVLVAIDVDLAKPGGFRCLEHESQRLVGLAFIRQGAAEMDSELLVGEGLSSIGPQVKISALLNQ